MADGGVLKYSYAVEYHVEFDFETYNEIDIDVGAWRYAEHPSAEILCFSTSLNHAPGELWRPGGAMPWWIKDRIWLTRTFIIEAHNAEFEKAIYRRICVARMGWPDIPDQYWRCSAAKAAAHSIPRDLLRAGVAMNCKHIKNVDGKRAMMKLSKPRRPTKHDPSTRWTHENAWEDYITLYNYNDDDISAEADLSGSLRALSEKEQEVWFLDQRMNERGVRIDLEAVKGALEIIRQYTIECRTEIYELTGRELHGVTQLAAMKRWIYENTGVEIPSFDKDTVAEFLKDETLPEKARRLLEYRQSLSKSSTKKFMSMLNCVCSDGRVRSLLMYHGAGTGRWSGKGIQIQNFPRRKVKDHEKVIQFIKRGDMKSLRLLYGDVMDILSSCLRGMIIATEGCHLFVADYAAIEARGLAWLSGQVDVITAFLQNDKGTGDEPYCLMASDIYGFRVNKKEHEEERQVGKVAILALGYQGGINAFATMAEIYKIDLGRMADALWPTITPEEMDKAEFVYEGYLKSKRAMGEEPLEKRHALACDVVKQRWRAANSDSVEMWFQQEEAAKKAIRNRGMVVQAGKMRWAVIDNFLFCRLPSGRCIAYREPQLIKSKTAFGAEKELVTYMDVDSKTKQWVRQKTYGGKIVENITQGVCRDVMAEAMLRADADGFAMLFTVHDEIVGEAPTGEKEISRYIELLEEVPPWAGGFPIKAEGWSEQRYRK